MFPLFEKGGTESLTLPIFNDQSLRTHSHIFVSLHQEKEELYNSLLNSLADFNFPLLT